MIESILSTPHLDCPEAEIILEALDLYAGKNIDFIDAYHGFLLPERGLQRGPCRQPSFPIRLRRLLGPLKKFRGNEVGRLGRAMVLNLGRAEAGTEVLEWPEIMQLTA